MEKAFLSAFTAFLAGLPVCLAQKAQREGGESHSLVTWVHSELKLPDFTLRQCFFGEHLLADKNTAKTRVMKRRVPARDMGRMAVQNAPFGKAEWDTWHSRNCQQKMHKVYTEKPNIPW